MPELRIVSQELWDVVKSRQKILDQKIGGLGTKKRPQHLLSGLLVCGECSGGYSKVNTDRYGCSTSRNKGDSVCSNKKTIKASILEDAVLTALETHLMRDELVQVFCEEYNKNINRLRSLQQTILKKHETELSKLSKEKTNLVQAIEDKTMKNMAQKQRRLVKKFANDNFLYEPSIKLVAGEGFEPTTFGL